jgi:hypothetical protein
MKRLSMISAMRPGVAMQRSCKEGGSGLMKGLPVGSFFTDDGKVLGDTWGAGLFGGFFVSGDFSRRSGVCGNGGGGFFCEVASEHEFELGGVELLAGLPEDAAAEGVDGLLEDDDLGGLTRDDFVALGALV